MARREIFIVTTFSPLALAPTRVRLLCVVCKLEIGPQVLSSEKTGFLTFTDGLLHHTLAALGVPDKQAPAYEGEGPDHDITDDRNFDQAGENAD